MRSTHRSQNYVQVMRRTNATAAAGACLIQALTALSVAANARHLAWALAVAAALLPFNFVVTTVLLPRFGPRAELVRSVINVCGGVLVGHVTGWPLANWLWLPFVAAVFDDHGGRTNAALLAFTCLVNAVVALGDGVPMTVPVAFVTIAALVRATSSARTRAIRDMLAESDAQRAALDAANEQLVKAHAEVRAESEARLAAELELRQAHKLEALGRLAAGVAHEINTPLQFIMNSVQFIDDALPELLGPAADADAADLAFARTELPECVQMTQQGVARVAAIVAALKELSHPERARSEPVDVNHAVTAALVVTKHEYRYVADVETSLGDVPRVAGHTGELMQVVINLVVNAAHAIADVAARSKERGRIRVATSRSGDDVLITVDDTGGGIPPAIRERIFEPFFTTKGPGRGTGQGLALARGIVERHRGSISFESHGGVGTTFVVRLPAHSTRKLLEAA